MVQFAIERPRGHWLSPRLRWGGLALISICACGGGNSRTSPSPGLFARIALAIGLTSRDSEPPPYTGHGPAGIPRYAQGTFTATERALLRTKYGIEDPNRLYVSDSTEEGLLKYDTKAKTCSTCYVNTYRVGFTSVRRSGETWEEVERRVRAMRPGDFSRAAHVGSTSTADLDPAIRSEVEHMLIDARRVGFRLRVIATYRSPEREALLMAVGRGQTHTLTSLHSYGRALDIVVGDGNLHHATTRASWIAFRRWVSTYDGDTFRILGTADSTWDWPHVEIPSAHIGFRTIEDALARARVCGDSSAAPIACDFVPHLPPLR